MSTCMWLSISSSLSIIVDWPWKHRLYLWEWSYKKLSSSETYGRWREQKTKGRRRGRAKQSHEGMIKLFLSVGFHIVNYNYIIYSGIPSCGHSIEMAALLLWSHYSDPNKSSVSHFFLKDPFTMATLLIRPDFCCPLVTRLMVSTVLEVTCRTFQRLVVLPVIACLNYCSQLKIICDVIPFPVAVVLICTLFNSFYFQQILGSNNNV